MTPHILGVEVRISRFDRETPTVRHRIACIDGEVHDNLLDLTRVRIDAHQRRRGVDDKTEIFADEAPEQWIDLPEHLIQVDHARLQDLSAAERENPARERRRALRRLQDLIQVWRRPVRRSEIVKSELGEAMHGREQVIEVVGDTACELSERFHFLRLPELLVL